MHTHANRGETQVDQSHYVNSYDTLERWSSYWYQLDAIRRANPKNMLEIGVGTGLTSWYARNRLGINVTTCDFDPELNPDVIADVRNLKESFLENQFDTVVAFQVLEHLPFNEFDRCLQQLKYVAKKSIIISLPHAGLTMSAILQLRHRTWKFARKFPRGQPYSFEKEGGGQHYWEVGVKGSSKKEVLNVIERHFHVVKSYLIPEHPYHLMIELNLP